MLSSEIRKETRHVIMKSFLKDLKFRTQRFPKNHFKQKDDALKGNVRARNESRQKDGYEL
ncbi:CLUMA_CG019929, isoform A [Clunio marinus]|uniref:CLUMA_CG019929, isoform A n=1 Tax=Clunio marinus TaxID=568069 RepID=A0A1J1J2T5_9DIPT|nr:CLUMA_CG019929, isoform A [Clunio marinus]